MPDTLTPVKSFDPTHIPTVQEPKHPCRYSIDGVTHTVDELKKIVADHDELTSTLKAFISDELAGLKSNAAELNLHLLDNPEGGVTLHLHIAPRHLGARPKVQRQPNPPPAAPKVDLQETLK